MAQPQVLEQQLVVFGIAAMGHTIRGLSESVDSLWVTFPRGIVAEHNAGETTHKRELSPIELDRLTLADGGESP